MNFLDISQKLKPYTRRFVYSLSILWFCILYYQASFYIHSTNAGLAYLMKHVGLSALILLYITFIPGILNVYLPKLPLNILFLEARRALGISTFFYALAHSLIGLAYNLSLSFNSLLFLSNNHQIAIFLGVISLIILFFLAVTSFDKLIKKMGFNNWKLLHRFAYIAAISSLFHAFLIGSHFTNTNKLVPTIINLGALTILILEIGATYKKLNIKTYSFFKKVLVQTGLFSMLMFAFYLSYIGSNIQYDPHAKHKKGYSDNYKVKLTTNPTNITTQLPIELNLQVIDKRNSQPVNKFLITHEKLMHLIIVSKDLEYYEHLHPEYTEDGTFITKTSFPNDNIYKLYAEYSPKDFSENLSILELKTSQANTQIKANLQQTEFTKTFANRYMVTLTHHQPLKINQNIDFIYQIQDNSTQKDITNLQTYLGAFGHLAIVSEDTETFTHVHPIDIPLSKTSLGGPTVRFNTYFPKTGKYKLFAQFKHEDKVFLTDFVVEVSK